MEERAWEKYFNNTVIHRNGDGRFVVRLTFLDNVLGLGESYEIVKRRLLAIERRFKNDSGSKNEYIKLMI